LGDGAGGNLKGLQGIRKAHMMPNAERRLLVEMFGVNCRVYATGRKGWGWG